MTYPGGYSPYYQNDVYAPEYQTPVIQIPEGELSGKELEKFITKTVWPAFETERERLFRLELWGSGKQPEVKPLKRNTERAVLQRLARTPWIPLMISTFAQQMIVDGYRREGETENTEAWKSWLRNKMGMQQISINRATATFGYSYVRVTDGAVADTDTGEAKSMAVMRGVDPMDCFALYEDPYGDEFPQYVLEKLPNGSYRWWLPNGDFYPVKRVKGKFTIGEREVTPYGTPPFVRYVNQIDLKGRCWGDVEPVIDLVSRIDIRGELDKIRAPALFFHSRLNGNVPLAAGRQAAEAIAGARFVELDSANHFVLADEPGWQVITREMRAFLSAD